MKEIKINITKNIWKFVITQIVLLIYFGLWAIVPYISFEGLGKTVISMSLGLWIGYMISGGVEIV